MSTAWFKRIDSEVYFLMDASPRVEGTVGVYGQVGKLNELDPEGNEWMWVFGNETGVASSMARAQGEVEKRN